MIRVSSVLLIAGFSAVVLLACAPTPTGPPTSDPIADACTALRVLECPEAVDLGDCLMTMRHAQEARIADYAPACVARARSVTDVRNCSPAWKNGCKGKRGAS